MADDSISAHKPRRVMRRGDPRLARHLAPPTPREREALAGDKPPAPAGRTYGYTRVSTDMQAEHGQSLELQRDQLAGWAQMTQRRIDQTIIESGVSGSIPFAKRPEGARLFAELVRGDAVVCTKIDRFSRNLFDCLSVAQEFQKRGVTLYLLDVDGADPVTGNGKSKLFLSMLGAFAEFERDRISARIRESKQRQKANGEYLGGPPPFGYAPRCRAASGAGAGAAAGDPAHPEAPCGRAVALQDQRRSRRARGEAQPRHHPQDHCRAEGGGMSGASDRDFFKARILRHLSQRDRARDIADMAEASRRGRLLEGEPEKPLPDVPLHKRGFGVMDEDVP